MPTMKLFLLQLLLAVFAAAQTSTSGLPVGVNTVCVSFFQVPTNNAVAYAAEAIAANATLVGRSTADEHLPKVDVKITNTGNTLIQASITNTGEYDLSVEKLNSIFDSRNVHKIDINDTANGTSLVFEGIYIAPSHRTDADSWLQIAKGDVFVTEFDAADLYDLSPGGNYTVKAEGSVFIQPPTEYTDLQLNYSSNTLYMEVDGAEAAKHIAADLAASERPATGAEIGAGCSEEQTEKIRQALGYCRVMASWGAWGAQSQDVRFFDYFHTQRAEVRDFVRCKFNAVAEECQEKPDSKTWFTCFDGQLECDYDSLAVANVRSGRITICDGAWQLDFVFTNVCHDFDLATTLVHEITHINNLHGNGLVDIPGHDQWPECKGMDWYSSMINAETYASFAQSMYLRCGIPY